MLASDETHFQNLFDDAKSKNSKLKYVAEFSDGKAKVGLKHIPTEHPFYNLEGKIILSCSTRSIKINHSLSRPAGAEVTVWIVCRYTRLKQIAL